MTNPSKSNFHNICGFSKLKTITIFLAWCDMALENPIVIRQICSHLRHSDLKNSRLVSSIWAYEGAKQFGKRARVLVRTHPAHLFSNRFIDPDPNLDHLADFLIKNQIRHTLMVSCVKSPWRQEYDSALTKEGGEQNDPSFQELVIPYLQRTGGLIPSARIEVNLCTEEDVQFLRNILSSLPQIRSLLLATVQLEYYTLEYFNIPPTLKAHSIRIQNRPENFSQEADPENMEEWLKRFDNIQFIDNIGCKTYYWDSYNDFTMIQQVLFDSMAYLVGKYTDCFPALVGVKVDLRWSCRMTKLIELPRPLTHIYLTVNSDCTSASLEAILQSKSTSLISFSLDWFGEGVITRQVRLPNLPCLKELRIYGTGWEMDNYEKHFDILNLRDILLGGQLSLKSLMPSLSSLSIILLYGDSERFWNGIFPDEDLLGGRITLPQIRELKISIMGDCDSPQIQRIRSIFPNLRTFCHLGEDENPDLLPAARYIPEECRTSEIVFVCRHDDNCAPRKDWWLDKSHAGRHIFWDYFANFENDLGFDV